MSNNNSGLPLSLQTRRMASRSSSLASSSNDAAAATAAAAAAGIGAPAAENQRSSSSSHGIMKQHAAYAADKQSRFALADISNRNSSTGSSSMAGANTTNSSSSSSTSNVIVSGFGHGAAGSDVSKRVVSLRPRSQREDNGAGTKHLLARPQSQSQQQQLLQQQQQHQSSTSMMSDVTSRASSSSSSTSMTSLQLMQSMSSAASSAASLSSIPSSMSSMTSDIAPSSSSAPSSLSSSSMDEEATRTEVALVDLNTSNQDLAADDEAVVATAQGKVKSSAGMQTDVPPLAPASSFTSSSSSSASSSSSSTSSASDCQHQLPIPYSTFHMRTMEDPAHEYEADIYLALLEGEVLYAPRPNYMRTVQVEISYPMRAILIDWLVEVAEEYRLSAQTLFLAVHYIDRLLSVVAVHRTKLQLVGITAILVAAKYEETFVPTIDQFVYISDNTYRRDEVLRMETILLTTLGFGLALPTALDFCNHYCRVGKLKGVGYHLACYIIEVCLQDAVYVEHRPSAIAAVAVLISRFMLLTHDALVDAFSTAAATYDISQLPELSPQVIRSYIAIAWPSTLIALTSFPASLLARPVAIVTRLLHKAMGWDAEERAASPNKAVTLKYASHERFDAVSARFFPPLYLLDTEHLESPEVNGVKDAKYDTREEGDDNEGEAVDVDEGLQVSSSSSSASSSSSSTASSSAPGQGESVYGSNSNGNAG